jgi:hypothetical protein
MAIDVDCTRSTKGHAAPELRSGQTKLLAQRPEQRRLWINLQLNGLPVDNKPNNFHAVTFLAVLDLIADKIYGLKLGASMTRALESMTDAPFSLFPHPKVGPCR